jgi:hypothetical protein
VHLFPHHSCHATTGLSEGKINPLRAKTVSSQGTNYHQTRRALIQHQPLKNLQLALRLLQMI